MLRVTANWWIVLAAAIPLTIATVYTWWIYVRLKIDKFPPQRAFLGRKGTEAIERRLARSNAEKQSEPVSVC
jgi:hypothetical protein